MSYSLSKYLCLIAAACTLHAAAAYAVSSQLLQLVPEGSQIVAGVENTSELDASSFVFTTINCKVDLDDWIALAGVDSSRRVDKLVQVAASSARGELDEHLLLLQGAFNRALIFSSAQSAHPAMQRYGRYAVLVLPPLDRDQKEMRDIRWLAIMDGRIAVFGSPRLVQIAMDRYAANTSADPSLVSDVARLRADTDSWTVLLMPESTLARHLDTANPHAFWSGLLLASDHLILGIHYGTKTRVDLEAHVRSDQQAQRCATALLGIQNDATMKRVVHVEHVQAQQDRVSCTLVVARKEFEAWLTTQFMERISKAGPAEMSAQRAEVA